MKGGNQLANQMLSLTKFEKAIHKNTTSLSVRSFITALKQFFTKKLLSNRNAALKPQMTHNEPKVILSRNQTSKNQYSTRCASASRWYVK
jgi:hypothetical protein